MWLDLKPIVSQAAPVRVVGRKLKIEPVSIKRCARCNAHYPVENFGMNNAQPDGLSTYCKPCKREVQQQSRDRMAERMEIWRKQRMKACPKV